MLIKFIGTGCGIPSPSRASPCILLSLDNENLIFDTGPGSLRELAKNGYFYDDIDYILYTHFHVDHISDLAPFIFASRYPLAPRKTDLTIIGPPSIEKFWEGLLSLYGEQIVPDQFNVNVLDVNRFKPEGWLLKTVKLPHTEESIGYRIEREGKVFVYSGDTGYSRSLIEIGRGADALILECSFPKEVEGHLSPELAGSVALECNAQLLILTHIYPIMDEELIEVAVRKVFDGKFIVARDGMEIMI